ncbi:sigma factor [Streptomyces sp. NPDC051907]|uniref:sigma factor n=1 Tax=Streptomyces sp. NPDC051907 TaxID=3155284 RepID=UPI0034242A4E
MDDEQVLEERFEAHRAHLRSVAYRMLGSAGEAEDAVREAWLRAGRVGADHVEDIGGRLTAVVARVCLEVLRSRGTRREAPFDDEADAAAAPRGAPHPLAPTDPEREAMLADSVGLALLVVLDTLSPAERLAFVLHDMFAVPFDEIAPIAECSPAEARQLADRARRRVRGAVPDRETDVTVQRAVVEAFLAASRGGDVPALLALLAPGVVLRVDSAAVLAGAGDARGAAAVAEAFAGRAQAARPALVEGAPGLVWAPGAEPRAVLAFTVAHGQITAIELLADPERLAALDLEILGD